MDSFCGSEFWNTSLTWDTDDPDFTPCFEKTVLTWIPCGFLWLAAIYEFNNAAQRTSLPTKWTKLGLAKWLNTLLIIIIQLAQFGIVLHLRGVRTFLLSSHADWMTPLTFLLTLILSIVIVVIHKRQRIHTSGAQFIFWILMFIQSLIILRTRVKQFGENELETDQLILTALYTISICLQLFLNCWADLYSETIETGQFARLEEVQEEGNASPVLKASYLSYLLFSWVTPFARQGYRKPVELKDLWYSRPWDRCQYLLPTFLRSQNKFSTITGHTRHSRQRSIYKNILKPLWSTTSSSLVLAVFLRHVFDLLSFVFPFLQGKIIEFVDDSSQETWKGYYFAILLLATAVIQTLTIAQYYYHMNTVYMNIQACLCSIVYRKALTVSGSARKESSVGQIVNLMSVDVEKIRTIIYDADQIFGGPAKISFALYLLWQQLGPSILAGLAVMILTIPITALVTAKVKKYQTAQMKKKDERIKLMNELLSGMRIVKLYAWELAFEAEISKIRVEEIKYLRMKAYYKSLINLIFNVAPFLIAEATFVTYVLLDPTNTLNAQKIFVSLSLFYILNEPVVALPTFITEAIEAYISCKRLNQFLNAEDVDPEAVSYEHYNDYLKDNHSGTAADCRAGLWGR